MIWEVWVTLGKTHLAITRKNYKNDHFSPIVAYYLEIKSIQ